MDRLAKGEKAKVGKKEMKDLTVKNYNKLPEVQKKRVEEEKKEALKKRMSKVKEMDNQIRKKNL